MKPWTEFAYYDESLNSTIVSNSDSEMEMKTIFSQNWTEFSLKLNSKQTQVITFIKFKHIFCETAWVEVCWAQGEPFEKQNNMLVFIYVNFILWHSWNDIWYLVQECTTKSNILFSIEIWTLIISSAGIASAPHRRFKTHLFPQKTIPAKNDTWNFLPNLFVNGEQADLFPCDDTHITCVLER